MPTCRECGTDFEQTPRTAEKLFCTPAHRVAFNNRRRDWGSAMFNVVMEMRFDRKRASASKAWSELCVIASRCRDTDMRDRGGRKSWSTTHRLKGLNSRLGR